MKAEAIECPDEVMEAVIRHVNGSTAGEVGGVLVGTLADDGVRIVAALPAHKATSSSANVTFTHEVWEEVLPVIDHDYQGSQLVGWYHSHPGFGVFLSEYDLFIQRNFFPEPRMVALVVDPLKGEGGWFAWEGDAIRSVRTMSTPKVTASAAKEAQDNADNQRRTSNLVMTAAVAFLVALIAGLLLGRSLGTTEVVDGVASPELAQLREENRLLREQVNTADLTADPQVLEACTTEVVVGPGDGWWSMAERWLGDGTQGARLRELNAVSGDTVLDPGVRIRVPAQNCRPGDR